MRFARPVIAISGLIGLASSLAAMAPASIAGADEELDQQVTQFFRTEDPRARARLLDAMVQRPEADVARLAQAEGRSVRQVVLEKRLLTAAQFDYLVSPENVMRLGSPTCQGEP